MNIKTLRDAYSGTSCEAMDDLTEKSCKHDILKVIEKRVNKVGFTLFPTSGGSPVFEHMPDQKSFATNHLAKTPVSSCGVATNKGDGWRLLANPKK